MSEDKLAPWTRGVAQARMKPVSEFVRTVYGGTRAIRQNPEAFLPRFPKETTEAYERRASTCVLYNATRRTVNGLSGMVFRRDPQLSEGADEWTEEFWDDVDLQGQEGPVFARELFDEGMIEGQSAIFVDRPLKSTDRELTRNQLESLGKRPYWRIIHNLSILALDHERRGGKTVFTRLRFEERSVEPSGEFKEVEVSTVREYVLAEGRGVEGEPAGTYVRFRGWRRELSDDADVEILPAVNMDIATIPIVLFQPGRLSPDEAESPLLDLAYENVHHLQTRSDNDTLEHTTKVPVFWTQGADKLDVMAIGAGLGLQLPPEATFNVTQANGEGADMGRQTLKDDETRMASLGLAMLQRETRAAETAESMKLQKSEKDSALALAARRLENTLNVAWALTWEWEGKDPATAPTVSVSRDFESLKLSTEEVMALSTLVEKRFLTVDTMWTLLSEGEWLPEWFDAVKEKAMLGEAGMADVAATLARLEARMAEEEEGVEDDEEEGDGEGEGEE